MIRLTMSQATLVALALCVLSACGGGSGDASPTSSGPLPNLRERVVTVAVETSSPPFSYIDLGGQGFGWDYDTVREICRRLNCIARFQQTAFQGVFEAVGAGQFDMLADGVTITAARQQSVVFSIPYVIVDEVLLVLASEPESLGQFTVDFTKTVGAQAGTINEQTAVGRFGAARVFTAGSTPEVVSAVLGDTIGGAVLDSVAANRFAQGNAGLLKTLGTLASGEQLAFAFPPNSPLLAPVNAALQSMIADGTLRALNIQWGVGS